MKTILLHGLGQTGRDWTDVVRKMSSSDVDCPELFSFTENQISYTNILANLERQYVDTKEPFRLCGLSLGAILALDFAIRHAEEVDSLILIGVQYKIPRMIMDFQNLLFRCMPSKAFDSMGISKNDVIHLTRSMRSLDFTSQLDKIACPVTILCGEKDKANLKASKELKGLIPQSTLHIIPNAGHEMNKCAPDAIAAILNQ